VLICVQLQNLGNIISEGIDIFSYYNIDPVPLYVLNVLYSTLAMYKNTIVTRPDKQKVFLATFILITWFLFFSCGATQSIGTELQEEDFTSYTIGVGDTLGITVYRNSDINCSSQVDTMGNISIPLVGVLKAAGLTPYQLQDKIIENLKKYITKPQITVTVSTYQSQKVTMIGEVNSPGLLNIEKPKPISSLISLAGGFTENANKENVYIVRKTPNGSQQITVNMKKVLEGVDVKQNILIQKNDTIYVPRDERRVTVLGEVNSPGTISINVSLGILEAITKAGNFTTEANKNNIIIIGKDAKSNVKIVDYQQILNKKDLSMNITLCDGDVIYVPHENKQILILGEINNPGIINNDPPLTLLEAIARKGGITETGNKSKVFVIRGGVDKANITTYNLKKLLKEGDVSQNVLLQKGDIVYVPPTFIASTEKVLNHVRSILSTILSAESAITFWPQTRQVLETGKSTTSSSIVVSPGQ